MWNLYNKTEEGIAIKSSGYRLKTCFKDQKTMILGKVTYVDYQEYIFPDSNVYTAVFHKRMSFQHEREARICFENSNFPAYEDLAPINSPNGMLIVINLKILIDSIYVSPDASQWFFNLVKKITNRYGLDVEVVHSDLYSLT